MLLVLTMTLSLAACRTDNSEIAVKIICPQVRAYDRATQERALAEYRALPQGSAIRLMLGDYKQLRDRIRRCNDTR
jgi:hypothetical protein